MKYSEGDYVKMVPEMYKDDLPGEIAKVKLNQELDGYYRNESHPYIFHFSNGESVYGINMCVKYKLLLEQDKELIDRFELECCTSTYNL